MSITLNSLLRRAAVALPSALALSLGMVAPAAFAAQTQIAQVPLLNITGTGTVKPNLMLLFDNSGSMDQTYTPDYVDDALCRTGSTINDGRISCQPGHPPFMSADFNKQYYNPRILYSVPIKSDGSYYPVQNSANTSGWSNVSGDGFGVHKTDLTGNTGKTYSNAIDLLNNFPDLKWCQGSSTTACVTNSASYTYPNNVYNTSIAITGGPYYYTIGVAEYCADDSMTSCKSTSVGAAAPAGYPVPVKVRWCSDLLLLNCQAKRVKTFIYPRYSSATGATASYGTIAIGSSNGPNPVTINNVTVGDASNTVIVNSSVTSTTGTNSALKQQTMASALAAAIIARGTTLQYMACVRTPTGQPTVSACSLWGINLSADNIVAVIAVQCSGSPKTPQNCVAVSDSSRSGAGLTVTTNPTSIVPATSLLSVTGTTPNSGTLKVTISLNGTAIASNIALGNNKSAATTVSTIVNAIGQTGQVRAYVGGDTINNTCKAKSSTFICLLNYGATGNTDVPSASAVTNLSYAATTGSGFQDVVPTVTSALSAGTSAPNTFTRVNIVSGQTYPKSVDRTDCVAQAGVCTYAEEMTNFANWYVYYKSRLQMMKTSVGIAFSAITANYKVGFSKLSTSGASGAIEMKPADFTGTSRATWYTTLYNTTTSGSTPSRIAMDNVGRMFANLSPYNYAAGQEVVQFPCQQNFMIFTTDGYWNGGTTTNVVNNDNKEDVTRFCTYARGCVDIRDQSQPSIADVALHWYNGGSSTGTVSLRPALEPDMTKPGSVPAGSGENSHLHVNTYTLGLGVDGVMTYEPNYDSAPKPGGDFYNLITQAASGCPWSTANGGAYVWPDPDVTNAGNTVQERVDDLWHAAINGHGKYFSASEPKEVVAGLSEALANMQIRIGAAAAAATSTPNISQQDNDIFSDTFTTVKWYGELSDKKIDPATGIVGNSAAWISSDTVGQKVAAASDSRTIYMLDSGSNSLKAFSYGAMSATEKGWFDNKCTALSQCTLLSASDKALANSGLNLVNWLRGQQQYADDNVFRAYTLTDHTPAGSSGPIPIVLGDIASSKPAYLRDPRKSYITAGYSTYKDSNAGRAGTVFTAANDGMLHAFSAVSGEELWAYTPRITMKKLYALASTTYGTNHQFTTDGSPELADVQIAGVWKTVLVAGLNGGGRGYYALDVTDPANPRALWELCADATVCSQNDGDLGLSFGNPQFGTWKGKWVVFLTSGYNNVPGADGVNTGTGQGFLYIVDVASGAVLKKVSTLSGDTTTPSGLAKITSISLDPNTDPQTTYIYGGDNKGQMWRFDLTDQVGGAVPVVKMGDAGVLQPVTTRPDVTLCGVTTSTTVAGITTTTTTAQRVVLFGTGRLLDVPDTANTDTQSLYLLKDSGNTTNIRGSGMVEQTLSQIGSGSNITFGITSNAVDLSQKDGWFFDWKLHPGERMNLDPQIVSSVANVVTNLPTSSSSCSVGGSSNAYQVNICTGNAVAGYAAGTILSNTSAAVGFIIIRLPNGQLKMISTMATGETKTSSLQEDKPVDAHRVGWRRVKGE
jgi:type IV pilus assembly protein PilY1